MYLSRVLRTEVSVRALIHQMGGQNADCKERGGADMHAWVSRSSTTAWHGSRADGHGLKAQESILQLHEPSASEGQ